MKCKYCHKEVTPLPNGTCPHCHALIKEEKKTSSTKKNKSNKEEHKDGI